MTVGKTIRVYINRNLEKWGLAEPGSGELQRGYQEGDALELAANYELDYGPILKGLHLPPGHPDEDEAICELIFHALNTDNFFSLTPAEQAIVATYRRAHFPSLSVGDLVEIDGRRYACKSMSFKRVG